LGAVVLYDLSSISMKSAGVSWPGVSLLSVQSTNSLKKKKQLESTVSSSQRDIGPEISQIRFTRSAHLWDFEGIFPREIFTHV
jgi:hypothetical protein